MAAQGRGYFNFVTNIRPLRGRFIIFVSILLASLLSACTAPLPPSWEELNSGTEDRLTAIEFADEMVGYAVGGIRYEQDRLLSTRDGGNTWRVHPTLFGQTFFDVEVVNKDTVYAAGIGGKLVKTFDGGESWSISQEHLWQPMRAITVAGDGLVVAVGGGGYNSGLITRSEDFGRTWKFVDTFKYEFRDIAFTDKQTGFACGYGVIFKTTDGGKTWDLTEAEGEFFSSICFPSASVGYAAGRTGTIVKTTDGGNTWQNLRKGDAITRANHFYNQVYFSDEFKGYVVGDKGVILMTTNGGATWDRWERNDKTDYYGISVLKSGKGYLAGESGRIVRFQD